MFLLLTALAAGPWGPQLVAPEDAAAARALASAGAKMPASASPRDSCLPVSEKMDPPTHSVSPPFCATWNPEFRANGSRCCAELSARKRRIRRCVAHAPRGDYCLAVSPEQKSYRAKVEAGEADVLEAVRREMGTGESQSYCSPNNGFLAWGRPIVPTPENGIRLRTPGRCTEYGTDGLVGMVEWVARQARIRYPASEHPGFHLLVGDVSAPRGGCLLGRGGHRGHSSHTSGLDADVGFLVTREPSPAGFSRRFDPAPNWWLLKKLFENPFACVKVIFLDRAHIRSLARHAVGDPDWPKLSRFLRHVRGHRNHYHVRVGDGPGLPGCVSDPKTDLEILFEADAEPEDS